MKILALIAALTLGACAAPQADTPQWQRLIVCDGHGTGVAMVAPAAGAGLPISTPYTVVCEDHTAWAFYP